MAHPNIHAKSSAKKFGGKPEDYIHLHEWMDETKGWFGDSLHRMFRHHSEGIFEMEKRFGTEFKNSDGKLYRHEGEWKMHAIGEGAQGRTFKDMLPLIQSQL